MLAFIAAHPLLISLIGAPVVSELLDALARATVRSMPVVSRAAAFLAELLPQVRSAVGEFSAPTHGVVAPDAPASGGAK